MSEVLYRKYRPQGFKDVLGQEHIVDALSGALKQGNIAHAYLFSGSRGTGKTEVYPETTHPNSGKRTRAPDKTGTSKYGQISREVLILPSLFLFVKQ